MARAARVISQSGIYHIVFRGVNRQHIFEESVDYEKLVEILNSIKIEMKYEIYAFCLMSNHAHILLKEKAAGEISLIMKRVLTKYARWYNIKYGRSGALIANRYKSKAVELDEYFLCLVRYIHQNPKKAGLVDELKDYEWSSYNEYIFDESGITDKDFILEMISKEEFLEFHKQDEESDFNVDGKVKLTDDEIRRRIIKKYKIEPKNICTMEKKERNAMLNKMKKEYSIRQLERVTGISRGIIYKS